MKAIYTIPFIKEFVKKQYNAECLSDVYINAHSKLDFLCENSHKFSSNWNRINNGHWCPYCAGSVKKTILEIDLFVKNEHFGECISTEYKNSKTHLEFKCQEGHLFKMIWGDVSQGRWCPDCRSLKKDINEINDYVYNKYNGKCLSVDYKDQYDLLNFSCEFGHCFKLNWEQIRRDMWCKECISNEKLEEIRLFIKIKHDAILLSESYNGYESNLKFLCQNNHIFYMPWKRVKKGTWCLACSGKMIKNIDEINNYVFSEYEGKCISDNYINNVSLLNFVCKNNHNFQLSWASIKNNVWCKECSGKTPIDLFKINEFVFNKYNGKCISDCYTGCVDRLQFVCSKNHSFNSNWSNVYAGYWCPYCAEGFGEKLTRYAFEKLFGFKFLKLRCDFLINPESNRKLELDGFCKELMLAFEYQGAQHLFIIKAFKMTTKDLLNYKKRDQIKKDLCAKNGVILIEIDQFNKKFKKADDLLWLKDLIKTKCLEKNVILPENFDNIELLLSEVYSLY